MSPYGKLTAFMLLSACLAPGPGCFWGFSSSTIGTNVGSLRVVATIDGPASGSSMTENGKSAATVTFDGNRTVVVEETRVLVDGLETASIPESAKKVEIEIQKGNVTILIDGKPVP